MCFFLRESDDVTLIRNKRKCLNISILLKDNKKTKTKSNIIHNFFIISILTVFNQVLSACFFLQLKISTNKKVKEKEKSRSQNMCGKYFHMCNAKKVYQTELFFFCYILFDFSFLRVHTKVAKITCNPHKLLLHVLNTVLLSCLGSFISVYFLLCFFA